jgi:hypothetical protein
MKRFINFITEENRESITLADIYGSLWEIEEGEVLADYLRDEDFEIELPIYTLSTKELQTLRGFGSEETVMELFEYAEPEQVELVNHYVANPRDLHEFPIVVENNAILDGYHRIMGAIKSGQSLKAVNTADLPD